MSSELNCDKHCELWLKQAAELKYIPHARPNELTQMEGSNLKFYSLEIWIKQSEMH